MEEGKEMFHAKQDVNDMLTCLIILTNYNHYLKHSVCKDHNIFSVFWTILKMWVIDVK